MPLELVTTTQQYKNQFAASLAQTNLSTNGNESIGLSLRKEDVSLDQIRKELNHLPSRVTAANVSLTTTLQDIDEIKLYRTRKEKPGLTPQPPPQQPPSSAMKTRGNVDENGIKNQEKVKGGRKLVGRAILREIQEMAELKDVEARKASNLQNDVAVQEMVAASHALNKAAYECRHMLIRNRFHNNHRIENVNTLDHIRRDYLKKNEKRREDISIYPKRLENHCQPNNIEESIDWALQTSEFYKDYVEEELFGMTVDGKNALFSSSSEEEDEDDDETTSKDKSKKKKQKDEKEKFNPHSPLPPNNPLTRSPRMLRTPRSPTTNHNNTSPLSPKDKKEGSFPSSNKQKKAGKEPEVNILEVDMAAKLSGRLNALDKSLYREMIRQNKLIQMQNRNRSMMNHRRSSRSSRRSSPNTSKSPTNKRNSNLNRRARSNSSVGGSTLRTVSRDTEADSDNNTAEQFETSSTASRRRKNTFEDTGSIPDGYYDSPLSRSTSASSVQSPKSSKTKSFSFAAKLKSSKQISSPKRESLKTINNQQKSEELKLKTETVQTSGYDNKVEEPGEKVTTTTLNTDKEKEEGKTANEANEGDDGNKEGNKDNDSEEEDDDEDEEEDDDDEFDTTHVQPVLPQNMRKLLVSTYLQHSFLKAIPADPRGTILHKRPLTIEQQDELMQDRARKMAMVDSIVEELLLEQKEKYDPWHKAMTALKEGDSNEGDKKTKGKQKGKDVKNKTNKNEKNGKEKDKEDNEEEDGDSESINKYVVNYEAMFQDFDQTKLKPTNGTIYFVSPIGTTLTQDNTKGTDYAEHSIPFREGETKTAIMRSKMKERHVTGYTLSSKQLVKQISPRKEGQQIVEEVQDYMKQYSILKQTKGIRTEVEENMKQLKETCLKKTRNITDKALNLVQQWKSYNQEKEQLLKDEIQYLRDREFKISTVLRKRQKQFQKFDDKQSSYLTYQIPDSQYSQDKLHEIGFELDKKTDSNTKRGDKADVGMNNKENAVGSTFVTQMPQKSSAAPPRMTVKQSPRRTMISNLAISVTGNAATAAAPVAVVNLGGSAISDNKFTYAYANQLEIIIKQNEEREKKEETHRIISKQWFVSLLQKLKRYKRSSSNRLPLSLFLLLSSLKKLIALNIVITKDIVWTLIDRTIQSDEHKSDLVYSTLKLLFDAVQVTVEDIYYRLKNKQIELSPKLLMQIQRERKLKQIKAKILMANRMNAANKDRSSFRKSRRASSTRKTILTKEEREDPAMSGLQSLRNARASMMHGVMDAIGEVDLTEEDYAMLMEDEDAMKFFDSSNDDEDDVSNSSSNNHNNNRNQNGKEEKEEEQEGFNINNFHHLDIDQYFQKSKTSY